MAEWTTARDRRSIASWLFIFYVLTLPLRYPYKDVVWMVYALSEGAMIISLLAMSAAETPVEAEGDES